MTPWKQRILDAFAGRSAGREEGAPLRLRSVSLFPDFDTAPPDEKESYLEAAEALERGGILSITWEKRRRGEQIKTLCCGDFAKLFQEAGLPDPRLEAAGIRRLIREALPRLEQLRAAQGDWGTSARGFLAGLAENFALPQGRGMDRRTAEDLLTLVEFFLEHGERESVTTRSLSVQLFHDSKRLEAVIRLAAPFLTAASKQGFPCLDLSFLERSFPETLVAGKIAFVYAGAEGAAPPPLINEAGFILGLPFSNARRIRAVRALCPVDQPRALTVENKESFHVLAALDSGCDCCLYAGGYPNQAAAAVIRALAASGFRLFHAGDLDPGGILILQNIGDIAGKPVRPLMMDAAVFERYLPWARPLSRAGLRRLAAIREDTRRIPGLDGLIRRIEETRRGVEQELIDYRDALARG